MQGKRKTGRKRKGRNYSKRAQYPYTLFVEVSKTKKQTNKQLTIVVIGRTPSASTPPPVSLTFTDILTILNGRSYKEKKRKKKERLSSVMRTLTLVKQNKAIYYIYY